MPLTIAPSVCPCNFRDQSATNSDEVYGPGSLFLVLPVCVLYLEACIADCFSIYIRLEVIMQYTVGDLVATSDNTTINKRHWR